MAASRADGRRLRVDTEITRPRLLWREKRGDALIVFSSL
jgi:hypothetical protein